MNEYNTVSERFVHADIALEAQSISISQIRQGDRIPYKVWQFFKS
jgi:hypothetical protein